MTTIIGSNMFKQLRAFLKGIVEFRSAPTTRWDSFDELAAYELGREGMHRMTFRRFEQ